MFEAYIEGAVAKTMGSRFVRSCTTAAQRENYARRVDKTLVKDLEWLCAFYRSSAGFSLMNDSHWMDLTWTCRDIRIKDHRHSRFKDTFWTPPFRTLRFVNRTDSEKCTGWVSGVCRGGMKAPIALDSGAESIGYCEADPLKGVPDKRRLPAVLQMAMACAKSASEMMAVEDNRDEVGVWCLIAME